MQANILFEEMVRAIDKAYQTCGFLEVCDSAMRFGMAGGKVESFNALRYEFTYADNLGGSVTLNVRSYDPSGPFQNEPDINRFTVKLLREGREIASHDRSYQD
jgi:hypothetical protein